MNRNDVSQTWERGFMSPNTYTAILRNDTHTDHIVKNNGDMIANETNMLSSD